MVFITLILQKFYLLVLIIFIYYFYNYIILSGLLLIFIALCSSFKIFYFTSKSCSITSKIYLMQYSDLNWLDILALVYDTLKLYFLKNKIKTNFFIQRPKYKFIFILERLFLYSLRLSKIILFFIKLLFTLQHNMSLQDYILNTFIITPYKEKIIFFEDRWDVNL